MASYYTQTINEPINVTAVFEHGRLMRPDFFEWRRRDYHIEEITSNWKDKINGNPTVHYTVVSSGSFFELYFDSINLNWTLKGTSPLF